MKPARRKFLKAVTGWLGVLILLPAVSPFALTFAQRAIKPKGKHPKDVLCNFQPSPGKRPLFSRLIICRDYIATELVPGKPVPRQGLINEQDCSKCMFEDNCVCSGTRFSFAKKGFTRTHYPELYGKSLEYEFVNPIDLPDMWSRKLQKKWYEKYFGRRV